MSLTIAELEWGITFWGQQRTWPHDFHNAFYARMAEQNPNGHFDEPWWTTFLPILRAWIATRPRTNAYLTERAHARLQRLSVTWDETVALNLNNDIANVEWQQIATFPALVAEIKDVKSPVFTSKFCHLLAPRIFPVVDNAAMGNPFPTYKCYYISGRDEWLETDPATQQALEARLTEQIDVPLVENYPTKCKLIELCLIGRHNNRHP